MGTHTPLRLWRHACHSDGDEIAGSAGDVAGWEHRALERSLAPPHRRRCGRRASRCRHPGQHRLDSFTVGDVAADAGVPRSFYRHFAGQTTSARPLRGGGPPRATMLDDEIHDDDPGAGAGSVECSASAVTGSVYAMSCASTSGWAERPDDAGRAAMLDRFRDRARRCCRGGQLRPSIGSTRPRCFLVPPTSSPPGSSLQERHRRTGPGGSAGRPRPRGDPVTSLTPVPDPGDARSGLFEPASPTTSPRLRPPARALSSRRSDMDGSAMALISRHEDVQWRSGTRVRASAAGNLQLGEQPLLPLEADRPAHGVPAHSEPLHAQGHRDAGT